MGLGSARIVGFFPKFRFMGVDESFFCLVICGKWESFPREFAKCRRCRKAKYCGKECQSTAWSEGHRFWCSAKDVEEDVNAVGVDHGNSAAAAVGVVGAGDHMQVQVQDQGDHGDLPGIHIAVDTMRDGNVPVTTATGGPNLTLAATRPERRRHGMGHAVGDGDISIQRHAAAPGAFGHGLAGPGTTGAARAELSMSRDRTVQPHRHHHHHHHVATRQRLTIRPPTGPAVSDSSPTTATVTANTFSILQQQQHLQLQDPMNTSHLSFHIQSTTPSALSSPSSLTAEQRRSREQQQQQQQQQQQSRSLMSRRRADTVTGVSISSSTSTSGSTPTSASLTASQRAMVQAQLQLQEVPPNVVMSVTAGVSGHHHHQHHPHHHHMLRNRYQTQTQNQTQGDSSSSSVVGDWSMGSPVHTPLSSSSSSSSSAAAGGSRPEPGPSSSPSSRRHRTVNPTRSPLPPAPPLMGTPGSRQKAHQRHGDGDEDEGDECDYEEQEEFGDDDMVLG